MLDLGTFLLLALTLHLFQADTQSTRIQRHDSVTVSAGLSKEQLAKEDQLNAFISAGNAALKSGNFKEAIQQYQTALDFVEKQPLLKDKKDDVLRWLARGYIRADRPTDAIPIFYQLLVDNKYCQPQSSSVSLCADAQFDLGMAKLHAHDFEGALLNLREAEVDYAKAEQQSDQSSVSHDFRMIQVKAQGQTNLWIAAALFQLADKKQAISAVKTSITQLNRVQSDQELDLGIKSDAARSLQEAQAFLQRLQTQ